MLGVPGLDAFGLFHATLGLLSLVLGLVVLLQRKGRRLHRRTGYAYVSSMLLLNGTALTIYDLYGRFGPFHIAAIISLATVGAALVPALTRRPDERWLNLHAEVMCWSYVGLVSAFIAEITVRLPGISIPAAAIGGTTLGVIGGAVLIRMKLPGVAARFQPRVKQAVTAGSP